MSATRKVTFACLMMPDGEYQLVQGTGGGGPLSWIGQVLNLGGVIHHIEVELPVPEAKPRWLGKIKTSFKDAQIRGVVDTVVSGKSAE